MPQAVATFLGKVVQYLGATTSTYTHGYFYECVALETSPVTYEWQQINMQPVPKASEFPNYDLSKKQMLVHNANSDVIEWEDVV